MLLDTALYSRENVCGSLYVVWHSIFTYGAMYLPVPALTKVNSLEDEGIVLKAEGNEEQKKEIKTESGVERQETKEEKQMEQFNEPSTSSGSACPEVKRTFFSVLCIFVLMIGEVKPTSFCIGSVKR